MSSQRGFRVLFIFTTVIWVVAEDEVASRFYDYDASASHLIVQPSIPNNYPHYAGDHSHHQSYYQPYPQPQHQYPHHHQQQQQHHHHHQYHHYNTPCICVPYNQCKQGAVETDGAGLLDPRSYPVIQQGHYSKKCRYDYYVCCPVSYLTTTMAPTTTMTTTTTATTTSTTRPPKYYWGCGVRNRNGIPDARIVNPSFPADEALFGEFPWQAAILKRRGNWDVFVCGGSLIDYHYIVTAAHCIKSLTTSQIKVRLGEWDTKNVTVVYPKRDYHVEKIIIHPDFNPWNLKNDIALLKLDAYVLSTPHISPICLPSIDESFDNLRCTVTGWGKDNSGYWGRYQSILKKVDVPVVSNSPCQDALRRTRLGVNYGLDSGFLCAGGEEERDACKGDGGGPLACEKDGVYKLAGIVSWGIGCGQNGIPGVYAKVSQYVAWILTAIEGGEHYYEYQEYNSYPWG